MSDPKDKKNAVAADAENNNNSDEKNDKDKKDKAVNNPTQSSAQQTVPQQVAPIQAVPLQPYPPQYTGLPGSPGYYAMPYRPYAPMRPRPVFNGTDSLFAALSFVVGFLLMRYVVWYQTGYFTTAVTIITLGFVTWYLIKRGYKLAVENCINAGVILLLSLVFSFTSNKPIKGWTAVAIICLTAYFVFSVCSDRKLSEYFFKDLTNAVFFPFSGFSYNFSAVFRSRNGGKKGRIANIMIGLAVSIPLFIVVLLLLVSADKAMSNMVENIFDVVTEEMILLIPQFILGIPIAMYLFGMLFISASKRNKDNITDEAYRKSKESGRVLPKSAVFAALMPILLLYALFFFSQLPYFLSGFSGKLPGNLTYADYAREGFFQLVALTVINLVIIIIMQRFSRDSVDKKSFSLRIFSILFSVTTLVLVASALSKMIMYIQSYGLTRARVNATWAIVVIALAFIFIIIKQLFGRFPLIRSIVVTAVLMFGVLAFSRVDYQIAKYNITMYKEGHHKRLDFGYLINSYGVYGLGDEALLYILENDEIGTLQKAAHEQAVEYYGLDVDPHTGRNMWEIDIKEELKYRLSDDNRYRFYNLSSEKLKRLASIKLGIVFD